MAITTWVVDVFQVKRLERKLGRSLSEAELSGEHPVRTKDANGAVQKEYVKRYRFQDFCKGDRYDGQ